MNTFDWDKCRAWVAERQPLCVAAGLTEDWFWTAADIYRDGQWIEDHGAYLMSHWATPSFKAEMPNGDTIEVICSRKATPEDIAAHQAKQELVRARAMETLEQYRAKRDRTEA